MDLSRFLSNPVKSPFLVKYRDLLSDWYVCTIREISLNLERITRCAVALENGPKGVTKGEYRHPLPYD